MLEILSKKKETENLLLFNFSCETSDFSGFFVQKTFADIFRNENEMKRKIIPAHLR